jgi:DNA-binding LacI/PurR family transcriptional regulator
MGIQANHEAEYKGDASARATLYDVAREAGVTFTTVSNVINSKGRVSETTRATVWKAIEQLDYRINPHAQRLARGVDMHTVALVALFANFDVVMRKIQGVQSGLQERGFSAPLHAYGLQAISETAETKLVAEVTRQRPRAIAYCSPTANESSWHELRLYQREGGRVIVFDDPCDEEFDQVLFDREHNTYLAAQHLLELGHRNIGFWMSGGPGGPRLMGFERAFAERNIPVNRRWFFGGGSYLSYEQNGVDLAEEFLNLRKRPTAMCIVNDSSAQAFVHAVTDAGVRVPEDLSVIGHDDTLLARYGRIPLTTVSHPAAAIAKEVINILDKRLKQDEVGAPLKVTVRGELIVRASSAPPLKQNCSC